MNNTSLNNPFKATDLQIDWDARIDFSSGWVAVSSGMCYVRTFQSAAGHDQSRQVNGHEVYLAACTTGHWHGSTFLVSKGNTVTGGGAFFPFK